VITALASLIRKMVYSEETAREVNNDQ
jgi:hypothetical protein